jgi:LDH2 family malate/lactate/ureidoglycolate dehydrogenase
MDASQSDTKYTKVTASDAQSFVEGVLTGNSVSKENASIIAKCLVQADLRGVDTHGINRIPSYMDRIRRGVLDPEATPSLTKITPVVAQVSDPIPRRTCQRTDNFAR